jgi:hypothetical protein
MFGILCILVGARRVLEELIKPSVVESGCCVGVVECVLGGLGTEPTLSRAIDGEQS